MPATLRTPDQAFAEITDFPYEPRYQSVDDPDLGSLRIGFVDVSPPDTVPAETVLCMHGEPSWSYLYRKMIPIFVAAGYRVVAPDLIGFGRSDKPAERADYTYARHVRWMSEWLEKLDLNNITLVCQDWGGLIGLRLVTAMPDRFSRISAANTFLPTGDQPPGAAFEAWRKFSQEVPAFPVGQIIEKATVSELSPQTVAAYDAPFPDETYKAGARAFPMLVPTSPDDPETQANREAWGVLREWRKPFLNCFSDQDPVSRGGDSIFQKLIPGAAGQPHATLVGGGHFLQEDVGEEWARRVVEWMRSS